MWSKFNAAHYSIPSMDNNDNKINIMMRDERWIGLYVQLCRFSFHTLIYLMCIFNLNANYIEFGSLRCPYLILKFSDNWLLSLASGQWTTQIYERNDSRCFYKKLCIPFISETIGIFFFSFSILRINSQGNRKFIFSLEWIPMEHGE